MKNEVEVLVYCMTYNHETFIRCALEGFVNQQTNFKYEVIVHDDASTDKTAEIIREYEAKYPELFRCIYETENQYSKGISYRRKDTLATIYGKYVALCEGDDYWSDPLKLQKQYDFMESHSEYTVCTHETTLLDMPTGKKRNFTNHMTTGDISFREIALWGHNSRRFPQTSSYFFRKEFSLCPDWMICDHTGDFQTLLNCALNGKVYFTEDVMSVYRYNVNGSWTSKATKPFWIAHFRNLISMLALLDKETGYSHTNDIFKAVVLREYSIALLQKRFRPLYYNSYGGIKRKYDWKLTLHLLLVALPKQLIKKLIPKPVKKVLKQARWRKQ